jgi:hypothetical protein
MSQVSVLQASMPQAAQRRPASAARSPLLSPAGPASPPAAAAAVAPPAPRPPIELAQLRRFTLGSIDLEQEILSLFAEQAPLMLAALVRAATEHEWRDATHTLKGSSASIGAWLVAEAAAAGELVTHDSSQWPAIRQAAAAAVSASLAFVAHELVARPG